MASTNDERDLEQWISRYGEPALVQPSTKHVTVTMMTPSEFKESWELPLSVCISGDATASFKLLACDGREMEGASSNVSLDRAIHHIFHPNSSAPSTTSSTTSTTSNAANPCLYLFPGDQSKGFEGYPTESPLQGPFTKERLEKVFIRLGRMLADRQVRLVGDHVGLGITFLEDKL